MNTQNNTFDLQNTVATSRLVGLGRMMTGYRLLYLGAALTLGIAAALKTATYLLIRYLIDDILGQGAYQRLPLIAAGFVGLALLEGGFTFLSGWMAARTSEGITRRLRDYLYDHIQRLSFSYHDKTQTGELIQRATSDIDAIRRFFAQEAIGAGRIVLLFSINFIAIAFLNRQLALISIIAIPVIVALSFFFFKKISTAYEAYQEQDARLSTTLQENLSGVRVVKAFARQTFEREKFETENWEKFQRGRRLLIMHSLFWPVSDTVAGAQMLGAYLAGALMAINGVISPGTYLAFAGMVIWIIWPMRNLGRLIVQMSTAMVSFGRITEVLSEAREPISQGSHAPKGHVKGDILFEKVGFEYEPGQPVLEEISFHARPGMSVALLGSTGSGKTSLVNLLPRFYDYTSGSLTLDGVDLKAYSREFLRRQIGIVEQEPFLFSRTLRENITYGVDREVTDEEVFEAAKAAAIHEVVLTFPEGYQTLVGERGVTLSGGQKQRVAIARTLLKDPRILILDDSTSSVDTETEVLIRQALAQLMQGRTTFIIAHRIQSVLDADLILVLDHGRIVERGTHSELLAEDGIYRRVFDVQARIEDDLVKELSQVNSSGAS